jgi:hypothetical protein
VVAPGVLDDGVAQLSGDPQHGVQDSECRCPMSARTSESCIAVSQW